jgi:hydroxymethylglutaryl-CoA lyase
MNSTCSRYTRLLKQINPQLFDVTLRDGIQAASVEIYTTSKKKDVFHNIMDNYKPSKIEVGSIVSPKVLPIMRDSIEIYNYVTSILSSENVENTKPFLLIPNKKSLKPALDNNVCGISLITSVSDDFQQKNVKMSLTQTKLSLYDICYTARIHTPDIYIKLYISCISECPIMGKMSNDHIIREILCYNDTRFSELCLSDTCGTLSYSSFQYIVDSLLAYGFDINKLSLHLHVSHENQTNTSNILFYCFEKGINKFDVSLLESGGCSVTMGKNVKPNLSYELFQQNLHKYIMWKTREYSDV